MTEIVKFHPEEIDEAIEALDGLRNIIAPVLRRINGDGMGEQDAQQFIRHLTLAKHALIAMGGFLKTEMKMFQTSSNEPLTLEELLEMDGEPVWDNAGNCFIVRINVEKKTAYGADKFASYTKLDILCERGLYRRRPEGSENAE